MKLYKNIFNVMANTHVKNVTIANFATVIILHLIAMRIAVRMISMKVLSQVPSGVSTPYGTIEQKKPIHQKN